MILYIGKPQIHKVCSKLASGCWDLYHLRQYIDSKSLLMVYYSLIHTHLNYCIISWSSASTSALSPLVKLQKRAVRIITFNNKRAHTKPLFWKLQVLKLNDIFKLEIGKIMHKINAKTSYHNSKLFVPIDQIHSHNTRKQQNHYFISRVHTSQAKKITPLLRFKNMEFNTF